MRVGRQLGVIKKEKKANVRGLVGARGQSTKNRQKQCNWRDPQRV